MLLLLLLLSLTDRAGSIKDLLGSDHPVLERVAQYFFDVEGGKKIRPTMVLLMSRACNEDALARGHTTSQNENEEGTLLTSAPTSKQVRLAEITEMIHTASLLHDDVIDTADSRRGVESVNSMFGNKVRSVMFTICRSHFKLVQYMFISLLCHFFVGLFFLFFSLSFFFFLLFLLFLCTVGCSCG